MKKIIIFLPIFLFIFAFSAKAQQFGGGLKAGMNFSQVDGDGYGGFHKFGFVGGGFVNYPLGKNNLLQAELLYSQKGSKETPIDDDAPDIIEITVNYIDLPITWGFQLAKNFWCQLGLMPSILVSGEGLENGVVPPNTPGFSTLNLSAVLGLNYRFVEHFSVFGLWSYSITNIRDGEYGGYSKHLWYYGQYNSVVSLGLQYHF